MTTTAETSVHPFEAQGLGLAPFYFTGLSENAICFPDGTTQAAGTCDYCGTGIRYQCHIRSHDGRDFIVGTDCVAKLDRADNRLVSQVDRAMKQKQSEQRRAEMATKRETERAEMAKRFESRRPILDAYDAAWKAADAEYRAAVGAANGWLIGVLAAVPAGSGGFISDMIGTLGREPIGDLGDRALAILQDIFAKRAGRAGSKANDAARDKFAAKFDESDAVARVAQAKFRGIVTQAMAAKERALELLELERKAQA